MNMPLSENYTLYMDGEQVPVYHTPVGDYAVVCFCGERAFRAVAKEPFDQAIVRPLSKGYAPKVSGNEIQLSLTDRDRVSVEPYGLRNPLFILCAQPIEEPENATHVYKKGTITDIGILSLHTGDRVYIEEGAVVIGGFTADRQKDIQITGNGILWGSPTHGDPQRKKKMMLFVQCEDIRVSGVTMIDCPTWHLVPIACERVDIQGVNIVGVVMSGDGIDVVGCEDVSIAHCFISVNDDCIAVKANRYDDPRGCKDAKNIRSRDCVLWSQKCGNVLEIGYETSAQEICAITFEDIDAIHCQYEGWQSGGVFTIHNGDRAHVHDVLYKNIRVEDAEEKLIDIKILSSKYSVDMWRGKVSDIRFEDIYVLGDILPPSIIRGYESELGEPNLIQNITIDGLYLNGDKIKDRVAAHLIAELSTDIVFL